MMSVYVAYVVEDKINTRICLTDVTQWLIRSGILLQDRQGQHLQGKIVENITSDTMNRSFLIQSRQWMIKSILYMHQKNFNELFG